MLRKHKTQTSNYNYAWWITNPLFIINSGGPPKNPKIEAMFNRIAGTDGEIDSEELMDMLTAHFSRG